MALAIVPCSLHMRESIMTFFETTDKFGDQLVEVWLSEYEGELLLVSWYDENDGLVNFDEIGTIGM